MRVLALLSLLLLSAPALSAPRADVVTWKDGATTLSGYIVWDDASSAKRPGLLMVPNWHGVNDIAVAKAKMIAGKDYVILLADMYGKGVRPVDDKASAEAVKPFYGNRKLMMGRVNAAWDALKANGGKAPIDMTRLGAIGFCFGGSAVLDLARSGTVPSGGIVTFHAGLNPDDPANAKSIKSRLLVLNGADDKGAWPLTDKFFAEMRASGADWQFVNIGGAVHCFTETEANAPGCMYDAKASERGYRMMHAFFDEAFAAK
ncbi:MAG TPA: dienelactone hydrolase family protein [Xanthomonadaceae bacterium]|jgi:dienelactone hydrolase|nr:dienelactone hydrolase family protein [Xanthomonadaceae bacterium]